MYCCQLLLFNVEVTAACSYFTNVASFKLALCYCRCHCSSNVYGSARGQSWQNPSDYPMSIREIQIKILKSMPPPRGTTGTVHHCPGRTLPQLVKLGPCNIKGQPYCRTHQQVCPKHPQYAYLKLVDDCKICKMESEVLPPVPTLKVT